MSKVVWNSKGILSPVFTAFKNDKKRSVNYAGIDNYAAWLKHNRVGGVLVNGTTGEGTTMKTEERRRNAEEWLKACQKHKMTCMIQVGGTSVSDVHELAAHAEDIGVDAVLCLPDLFFKPVTEEDLVHYVQKMSEYCPTRPLFYYHFPKRTGVTVSMPRFCDLAEKEINNFCGLKYTSADLEEGAACLKTGRTLYLGNASVLTGALALGFDSAIMTILNICPEHAVEIFEHMHNNKPKAALEAQLKLNKVVNDVCPRGADWVESMKSEFNRLNPAFSSGPCRKPK